jgi:bacteriorhodopsin
LKKVKMKMKKKEKKKKSVFVLLSGYIALLWTDYFETSLDEIMFTELLFHPLTACLLTLPFSVLNLVDSGIHPNFPNQIGMTTIII